MDDFIKKVIDIKFSDDSNELYHSKKDYISASGLKKIKVSPAHFITPEEKKDTEALVIGSAYHTYVLEKNKFYSEYYVFDEKDILDILISEGSKKPRSTNKYKEWYCEEEEKASGKIMIDINTLSYIKEMCSKIKKHIYANSLINNGVAEKSIYCELEIFSGQRIKIKIRPDYLKEKKRIITDLKSANDASLNGFTKDAAKFDYHIQAALYTMIMEAVEGEKMGWDFIFIAQEKKKPYAFNLFKSSAQFISQGNYEVEQLILLYLQCLENNSWPGYQVFCENKYGINEISLPSWAIDEINFYNHKF